MRKAAGKSNKTFRTLANAFLGILTVFVFFVFVQTATAHETAYKTAAQENIWKGFDVSSTALNNLLTDTHDARIFSLQNKFLSLVDHANAEIAGQGRFAALFGASGANGNAAIRFIPRKAVADAISTTLKYAQEYKGVELIGDQAMFHYDPSGNLSDVTGRVLDTALDVNPSLTEAQALRLLADRYQDETSLTEPARLRIYRDTLRDASGAPRLVYVMKTATTARTPGQQVFIDAHNGEIVVETDRECTLLKRTVLDANTPEALQHVDKDGFPTEINLAWYKLALKDRLPSKAQRDALDPSVLNAFRNSGIVHAYYRTRFNRLSFDGKDAPIVSVVHMGKHMNNAFWTDEYGIIAYGDGDGRNFLDLTIGRDVAGHELTHAVTAREADLIYQAEPGALNESYSDFFGKMIDFRPNDWLIGASVMGPEMRAKGRVAIRNMIKPEQFNQPGTNDSPLKVPTNQPCNRANDRCGVHKNNGIPNRAAALIVNSLGKENAEQLYYNVLTQRLNSTASFRDARIATEAACATMFGKGSANCATVRKAFDTVKM